MADVLSLVDRSVDAIQRLQSEVTQLHHKVLPPLSENLSVEGAVSQTLYPFSWQLSALQELSLMEVEQLLRAYSVERTEDWAISVEEKSVPAPLLSHSLHC